MIFLYKIYIHQLDYTVPVVRRSCYSVDSRKTVRS